MGHTKPGSTVYVCALQMPRFETEEKERKIVKIQIAIWIL